MEITFNQNTFQSYKMIADKKDYQDHRCKGKTGIKVVLRIWSDGIVEFIKSIR